MGRIKSLKAILFLFGFLPLLVTGQNYPRFELYQLKQGTDSGQFIVTGLDSNLAFNNILRFRSADSTFLIGTDTVITNQSIIPILLRTIDAGLGIEVNQVNGQIFIESLSIEDSIYNGTVSTISKGTPLYATGVQGNYWSVAPADASDPNKMPVVVIAGEDIASGAVGLGLIKGHIKQVNTTGLADGAEVYVASGGGYTSTKPTAEGVIIQRLGTVIKGNSTNGSGIINLGDEAYWSDYTSLTKLRDTLVVLRDSITNQIGDSLMLYVSRVELNDTLINYVDRVELNDSLALYPNRVELGDSLILYPNRVELGDSLLLYVNRVELGDSLALYPNRVELGDTASAIRTDIPLIINDSLTAQNFLTEEVDGSVTNELQTLSKLGLDITLSDGGGTVRDSILTEAQVDNYVSNNGYLTSEVDGSVTNELQTISTSGAAGNITLSDGGGTLNLNVNDADASTTNEIQNISTTGAAGNISISSGSTLTLNVNDADASVTNEGSLTVGAGTASTSVISSNTSGSTDVTLTAGTNITLSETGNNITITASGGGSSLWSEGATAGEIYYNSGNVGIGLTDPDFPLHVSGDGYFTDDLRAFDRIYIGGDFNHTSGSYAPYIDRYAATGETGMDFYAYNSGANLPLFRFFDSYNSYSEVFRLNSAASTYQIIADGDSDFNGDFNLDGRLDVNGIADFNSNQNSAHDFGVGSLNYYPFMWVDASADKMAVGGGTPDYTLDVTGDINFTGDLYDNGSLVSFTGTTINNNDDYRIITGSSTANTLNAQSDLTWVGGNLKLYRNDLTSIYIQNSTTGTGTNGVFLSLSSENFLLKNPETNGNIGLQTLGGSLGLLSNGKIRIQDLSGSGVIDVGANNQGDLEPFTSDTTLKTNIVPNEYGLKKVMDLETIKFNWKDKESKGSQKEVGFNAQNLQKVIPEATYTIPSNGKLGIKDDAIIATLTKAIQEQQEMIEELQKEIKRIKRKIK